LIIKKRVKQKIMNLKTIAIAALLGLSVFIAKAQDTVKIGYTNVEMILSYMPAAAGMQKEIGELQKKISGQMQIKESYAQQKLQEYMQKVQSKTITADEKSKMEDELQKLDQEIQKFAADSAKEVMQQREKLLTPILERLQNVIDSVAEADNYTYILNQTTSGGVSTILFGPTQNDATEVIMKSLGIEIPKEIQEGMPPGDKPEKPKATKENKTTKP